MNDASTGLHEADTSMRPGPDKADHGAPRSNGNGQGRTRQGRPSRKGPRRGNGKSGDRDRDGTFPFERTTIRLHHGATATTFDRSFDRFRNSFYHVTAVLQRLNLDEGIDLVQEYLQKMIDESKTALKDGKREVVAALEAKTGSKNYKLMVHHPAEKEARVPSYACRQYLDLFRDLDDYLNAVVYAESVGAITWRDRRTLFVNAPRHVSTIAGRFQSVGTRLSVHDLQQVESAFEALKAIVATAEQLPSLQESRSLALEHGAAHGEATTGPTNEAGEQGHEASTDGGKTPPAKAKKAKRKADGGNGKTAEAPEWGEASV